MKSRSKSGFTLVEILIVVVILGILAAIVIPQFSQASSDARVSSVKSNLQMLRSQVELYKIQHGDSEPDANSLAAFTDCLTKKSDIDGTVNVSSGAYGPYMQRLPVNAVSDKSAISFIDVADGEIPANDNTVGWVYDMQTGRIYAGNNTSW